MKHKHALSWKIGAGAAVFAASFAVAHTTLRPKTQFADPMDQARALMAELWANGWNVGAIDRSLLFLPDQKHAELPSRRAPGTPSFSVNSSGPFSDEIAFQSDLYVRMNPAYKGGDFWSVDPTGFFIVGWRNGLVTQVPVEDARIVERRHPKTGETVGFVVFPGMRDYAGGRPFRDIGKF
jgi:hypothetical protein